MHELRPFQRDCLESLARPGHVICVAPTGSGKSLIYETFAAESAKRTLLISPLTALARQQRDRFLKTGVVAHLFAGGEKEVPKRRRAGGSEVWILSPESLALDPVRRQVSSWRPDFLVVDECHCLWDWGERFRPSFRRVPMLIIEEKIARSVWLTATLPADARAQLKAMLPGPVRELGTFRLPENLSLIVRQVPWAERLDALASWLRFRREPGVVFASTRETTERIARLAQELGRSAVAYHAGLAREERLSAERRIQASRVDVVVATSAFGMGMDHPHLRWVLCWQSPPSLLALGQAIGRAGRGTGGSACVFWDEDDFKLVEWTALGSDQRREELREIREFLASGHLCREMALIRVFEKNRPGVPSPEPCLRCDFCRSEPRPHAGTSAPIRLF